MIGEAIAGAAQAVQQTINDRGSLGDYIDAIWYSRQLVQFWVLMATGTIGMIVNYVQKWVRDEIQGSLFVYVFHSYPKRTLLSFCTFVSYAFGVVISPVLDDSGWTAVINLGFTTGFAIDALVNKSGRQAWSDEKRAEQAAKP